MTSRWALVAVLLAASCHGGGDQGRADAGPGGASGAQAGTTGAGGMGQAGTTGVGGMGQAGTTGVGGSEQAGVPGRGGGGDGGSGGNGGNGGAGVPVTKIVLIGDSITTSSCWRAALWQTMNAKVPGRFDFVGSHTSDFGCVPPGYDQDNEASDGSLLSDAKMSELAAAFLTYKPDVALIHYGTDDVRNGVATNVIVDAHSRIVGSLRAANPDVTILVAKISPVNVTSNTCSGCTCDACAMAIFDLNQVLGGAWWRAGGVTMVDQYFLFDVDADTRDGVYPNDSGSAKIAANWAKALARLPQFAFWF